MCTKKEIIEVLMTYHGHSRKEAEDRYKTMSEERKKQLIAFRDRQAKYSFYND